MFGIIRPCRRRLGAELAAAWTAQLCGLCLALRDDYGQVARVATNYDGLVVSLLVEAQSTSQPTRRRAGPCPLRAMRRADVATGECVRLAAVVSLALAAAKVRDHAEDRDGIAGVAAVRPAARRLAERWVRQGADAGPTLGFNTGVLVAAMGRQADLEAAAGPGSPLLAVTEPTETAVAAAFAHTAVLAGRPGNQEPLGEVGRLFGRVAHLLDAVEDYREDAARRRWNPMAATATPFEAVRALCDDAALGIELALSDVEFTDRRLVHRLLTGEIRRAVSRTFTRVGYPGGVEDPNPRKSRRGQQEPINFANEPGAAPETPDPGPRGRRRGGDGGSTCICCCDSCDCCCCDDACCECGDCCDCT
ncbi:hypothetical protein MSAS_13190 [Mycobacterium saskatchewanense]|uniref:Regulatory protein n=1 Tax=Mycobacterium saskatchewanense TaxID=220927 RepID=A0AAJ3NJZ6_9MYCO|nr:DUF5685 family protein [Mycobacterium saskatchewanense]ORW64154.1 hypothetical protein AWC23_26290 [Mycobacterium saskatchewanense]BBX62145.1 hypothetical protein MSAS_13190 [Mycobacterium saskatchewanense]